jgi:hypothetical protein
MEEALCVGTSMPPILLRVALRVFLRSLLSLQLYTVYRARQRTPGRRGGYISPFVVTFRMYILLLCLERGDPQGRH